MNHTKPKLVGPVRPVCPVCGTTTYSQGGIHPQCAVARQDKVFSRPKTKVQPEKSATLGQWRKRCPRCKRVVPARRMVCDCGNNFQPGTTG